MYMIRSFHQQTPNNLSVAYLTVDEQYIRFWVTYTRRTFKMPCRGRNTVTLQQNWGCIVLYCSVYYTIYCTCFDLWHNSYALALVSLLREKPSSQQNPHKLLKTRVQFLPENSDLEGNCHIKPIWTVQRNAVQYGVNTLGHQWHITSHNNIADSHIT